MVSLNSRIGIIGAGTSGVYLAILLIDQGFQVTLFEKSPQPRTDGCGILIVQAGMKALHQGNPEISQKIINSGDPVKLFEFRNLRGGVINSEPITYEENELPGMLVHRKAILEALLDELPPDCIAQTEHSAIAHFKDGSHWEGDLLIGADGIVSKVRQFIVPDVELFYLGDIVWRGIVEDCSFCPEGNFFVYVRGRGIYANFFHIGGCRTHWGFFIEKDQGWEDGLSLSQHLRESANIAEALENFQTERLPIVHEYQRTSREISQRIGRR